MATSDDIGGAYKLPLLCQALGSRSSTVLAHPMYIINLLSVLYAL